VSVAFAGPVGPGGRVLAAPTVWGPLRADALDLSGKLRALWPGVPVRLLNDVSAAGYRHLRHARDELCIVTVSTGIGHKLFVGGRPVTGPHGRGGEIGHLRMDWSPSAPWCECGGQGHLGALASGTASAWQVRRLAAENPGGFGRSALAAPAGGDPARVDNRMLAAAFRQGDPWAAAVVRRMARPLGAALAALHLAAGVERFVVVGGFGLSLGPGYLALLARAATRSGWNVGASWAAMLQAGRPEDHAELVGAGRFAAGWAGAPAPAAAGRA
jgi:glucokinase